MQTLKKGMKGEDVKTLQRKLGLKVCDGIFGSGTETAVKAFQQKAGLKPVDGIVGPATWKALGVDTTAAVSKAVDESVTYKPLPVHVTRLAGRQIKYLAIHYTAGASSAPGHALGAYSTFVKRNASADFAVDDRDMVQLNPDLRNYYCWAVGDNRNRYSSGGSLNGKACNSNTISIEICCNLRKGASASAANHDGWYFTDAALENARKLARMLMAKYGIDKEHVIRHYDITGKLCPGIIGWNDEAIYDATTGKRTGEKNNSEEWLKFKASL